MKKTKIISLILTISLLLTAIFALAINTSAADTGTETTTPAAEISGKSVNFGGDISMKYYVKINDTSVTADQLMLTVTFLGTITNLTETTYDELTQLYVFTFEGINPQCMGDEIDAVLYIGGTEVDSELDYSVKANLVRIYADANDAQKQLIIDVLEYGAAAQVYQNYKTTDLVTSGLSDEMTEHLSDDTKNAAKAPSKNNYSYTGGTEDIYLNSATVNFSYTNLLRINYQNNGEQVTEQSDPIAPYNFGEAHTFAVASGFTLSYSINDYCYAILNGNYDDNMKSLASALYNYGLSAHILVGNHTGGEATCTSKAVCTVCGEEYGDTLPHNYTYVANEDTDTITETCNQGCGHSKTITLVTPSNTVYTGEKIEATVSGAIDATYAVTYSSDSIPVNVGTYTATLTVGDYSVSLTFEIAKANATVTTQPEAKTLTYNGSAQELVTAGVVNGGTMQYKLGENGEWSENIPTATDAGENYTVYYKVKSDDNHYDTEEYSVPVTIAKAELTVTARDNTITYGDAPAANGVDYSGFVNDEDASVLSGMLAYTYDYEQYDNVGTYAIKPDGLTSDNYEIKFVNGELTVNSKIITVKAHDVSKTYGDTDPALTYTFDGLVSNDTLIGDLSRVKGENVGTYEITQGDLTAGDNYEIDFTGAVFSINSKTITKDDVTVILNGKEGKYTVEYSGSEQKPTVTIAGMTEGEDYEVTYSNNVYVSPNATVTITFKGNYSGTFDVTFTISKDPDTDAFDGDEWVDVPTTTTES